MKEIDKILGYLEEEIGEYEDTLNIMNSVNKNIPCSIGKKWTERYEIYCKMYDYITYITKKEEE